MQSWRVLGKDIFGGSLGVQLSGGGGAAAPIISHAFAASFAAFWPLDEASGNAIDALAGNDLTDNNTVGSDTGVVYPLARTFVAASNENLSIADNTALSGGNRDFWRACWVNLSAKGVDRDMLLKWRTSPSAFEYGLIYRHSDDRFAFYVASGNSTGVASVSATVLGSPAIDTWYLVWVYHDAANDVIGIAVNDGAATTVAHATGVFDGTNPFVIGGRTDNPNPMQGKIGPAMAGNNYVPSQPDRAIIYNDGDGRRYAELFPRTYLLATFLGTDTKLYMLRSGNGTSWRSVSGNPIYTAATLADAVRDPHMIYRNGKYWICHTNGVFDATITHFSIISATDPTDTWTHVADVDMSVSASGINRVWAPKWFVDADNSVHIFVSCATSGDDDGPFQAYHIAAQNAELTSWSAPAAITITGKTNIIDPFVVLKSGTYYMWYKDETSGQKWIEYASCATLTGTYTPIGEDDWAGWGSGVEGATLMQLTSGVWRIYMDRYQANTGMAYSESTDDWATWSALVGISAPFVTRHGSVMAEV